LVKFIITSPNIFNQIRALVKTIPAGKVTTYGQIAAIVGTSPRVVGWALRGNEDMSLPCHRVVKKDGVLAANFSLGNWPEQRRRLQQEGLRFSGLQIIDFDHHFIALTALKTSI
jgi:methylated-DNA-protein-cysteine methyltransferase related protein